jgi:hypothetical protein
MFYRKEEVDSVMLCSICSDIFQDGDPRILPCGEFETVELQANLRNGTDQVKEYCIELRNQVHLQTDALLEQVH